MHNVLSKFRRIIYDKDLKNYHQWSELNWNPKSNLKTYSNKHALVEANLNLWQKIYFNSLSRTATTPEN